VILIAPPKQTALKQPNKGWHSRGYLPHFDSENEIQSLNFRLYDAVPMRLIEEWRCQLGWSRNLKQSDPRAVALRQRIETHEDAGYGQCFLRDSRIATLTEDALQYFDGTRYRLLAWCVMPNHVHSLIEMVKGYSLGGILHSWKSYTAKKVNGVSCHGIKMIEIPFILVSDSHQFDLFLIDTWHIYFDAFNCQPPRFLLPDFLCSAYITHKHRYRNKQET